VAEANAKDQVKIMVSVEVMSWLKEDFDHEGWDKLVFTQEIADGSSIAGLLQELGRKYPKFKQKAFHNTKQDLFNYCAVVHNGRFISALQDLDIELKKGDNIKLTPGFYGG
jgi:molybdopterin converting factor small subunit